ncbi:MAG TPA: RsmE family RNA methyltransferase [Flavobacteriales bacterium]|nr:RsmE family RNA methyltransferase [Flavobacteriales bacterium]
MHVFYTTTFQGDKAILTEEESLHLSKVLRLKEGASVLLLDGKGGMFEGEVLLVHKKNSAIGNLRRLPVTNSRPYRLHVAIAPTKMMERLEWFLEKATEIGIDEITPLITNRTERDQVKMQRVEKIVLAAMKQSMTATMPVLNEVTTFATFLKKETSGLKLIAHCIPGEKPLLTQKASQADQITILVGPEGDFTAEEVGSALKVGYEAISLGQSRLRAETAGVVVCAQVQASWQIKA